MNPDTAYAHGHTLSGKAQGLGGLDHVILSLYGPAGGTVATAAMSREQVKALIQSLESALTDLSDKRYAAAVARQLARSPR